MRRTEAMALLLALGLVLPSTLSAAPPPTWLGLGQGLAATDSPKQVALETKVAEVEQKDIPGPFEKLFAKPKKAFVPMHSFEGYSGGLITPTAYIINQDHAGLIGMPSFSLSYLYYTDDPMEDGYSLVVTVPFLNRFELGYGGNITNLGKFHDRAEEQMGAGLGRDDFTLHVFSLRGNVIKENDFDCPYVPAVTLGAHFKHNHGIAELDRHAFGTLRRNDMGVCGMDWTAAVSKQVEDPFLHRPLVGSVGVRITDSSHAGGMGFVDTCKAFVETNVFYKPVDWLTLGYEFRRMQSRYSEDDLSHLMGRQRHGTNWHMFTVGVNITEGVQLTALLGGLGTLGVQIKFDL